MLVLVATAKFRGRKVISATGAILGNVDQNFVLFSCCCRVPLFFQQQPMDGADGCVFGSAAFCGLGLIVADSASRAIKFFDLLLGNVDDIHMNTTIETKDTVKDLKDLEP